MNTPFRYAALCTLVAAGGCDAFEKYLERSRENKEREHQAEERKQAEAAGGEYRASGPDFSVAIPAGYAKVTNEEALASVGAGGFAIQAEKRASSDWFLASIAFVSAANAPEPATEDVCKETANQIAAANKATVSRAGIVEMSGAKHCQWETADTEGNNRSATGTVIKSPGELWVVTCNYDTRDAGAKSTCAEVLASWKNAG